MIDIKNNIKYILDDREIFILKTIRNVGVPMGSVNLVGVFEDNGMPFSQATIGRILNNLERKGFLVKNKNKGREITGLGIKAISDYKRNKIADKYKSELENILTAEVLNNFIMILDTRKIIEVASVREAAIKSTAEDIKDLEFLIEKKREYFEAGKSNTSIDIEFHTRIANIAGNDVLTLIYQIISQLGQQSEMFEELRKKTSGGYLSSHSNIVDAIKNHDPDRAEKEMISHIELLKNDVIKYWNEKHID